MNRLLRTCLLNNKNVFKLITNQSLTTFTKPFGIANLIKPVSTTNVLLKFDRSFNSANRFTKRRIIEEDDGLVEQGSTDEPSQSPKAHNVHSEKYKGSAKFEDYNLPADLLNRLKELGYESPFPIQAETLPHTLTGKDLIGRAITGSGKTLAFSIPIILKVLNSKVEEKRYPKCLVLSPTRELCQQIQRSIQELAPNLKCVAVYGGSGLESQMSQLSRGSDIVCATPGRLRDLLERRSFNKDFLELICLDEADELLTPNFLSQIEFVLESENKARQMLMFSATISHNVDSIVENYMNKPIFVDLTEGNEKSKLPENVKHFVVKASKNIHADAVKHFIEQHNSQRCIVFTNRKIEATYLSNDLNRMGLRTADLHSDHSQNRREQRLRMFRKGELKILVATDVAARGIDVPEVDLVIQVGPPPQFDFYIHRSGRTGRAGRPGMSITFTDGSRNEELILNQVKGLTNIQNIELPAELSSKIRDFPSRSERSNFRSNDFRSNRSFGDRNNSFERRDNSFNRRDGNDRPFRRFDNDFEFKRENRFGKRNFDDNDDSSRRMGSFKSRSFGDNDGENRPRFKPRAFGDNDSENKPRFGRDGDNRSNRFQSRLRNDDNDDDSSNQRRFQRKPVDEDDDDDLKTRKF